MDPDRMELQEGQDGIQLSRFHAVTAVLIAILILVLLLSTYLTSRSYTRMEEATERYISAQQAAASMQSASDYLTAQARTFIATGDLTHAELFFEETDNTRRRDHALEEIGQYLDSPSYAYLSDALDTSNKLLEIELYAMRLAAESYGCNPAACPGRLGEVTLNAADLALSPEEQQQKALLMVFDDTY